jgi:hypothetical protein
MPLIRVLEQREMPSRGSTAETAARTVITRSRDLSWSIPERCGFVRRTPDRRDGTRLRRPVFEPDLTRRIER